MAYNWNKMETITVPVGLNGWLYSGEITINGITSKFPVGTETSLPEPVAAMIRQMIAVEEADKALLPDNVYTGGVTVPAGKTLKIEKGAAVEDEAGVLGGGGKKTVVVLKETTLEASGGTPPGIGAMFSLTTPYENIPENGSTCHVTLNGTEYTCTAMLLVGEVAGMALGNLSAIGVDTGDSDLPFGIALTLPDQVDEVGVYAAIMTVEALDTITISITTEKEAQGKVFTVVASATTSNGMQFAYVSHTLAQILEAVAAGAIVRMLLSLDGTTPTFGTHGYVLPLTAFSEEAAYFCAKILYDATYQVKITADGATGNVGN